MNGFSLVSGGRPHQPSDRWDVSPVGVRLGSIPESLSPIPIYEKWLLGLTSAHMSFHMLSSFERASTMRTFAGPGHRLGSSSALGWRHRLTLLCVAVGQHLHGRGAPPAGQLERCWRWERDPGYDVGRGLGAFWLLEAKRGVGVGARTALMSIGAVL
jgi:hypothetical protein